MKKNIDLYDIYPLVVLEGKNTKISIFSKSSCDGTESDFDYWKIERLGGPFSDSKQYIINVVSREIHKTKSIEQEEVPFTIIDGHIVFDYTFYEEQEHMVFVYQILKEEKKLLTFFKLYSLKEDLFQLLPWKGEMHMHSNWSDGTQPPEIMYAYARRAGMEFAVLTDHYILQPNPIVQNQLSKIKSGLKIIPGEEVHVKGQSMHIVSVGAKKCISQMIRENCEEIKEEAMTLVNKNKIFPIDVDPVEYAMQKWVYNKIRENDGLAILAHPYWPHENNAAYLPTSLSRMIIREGLADAWEITGVDCGDKDFMQGVLYAEEREKGYQMPVVGSTDAHNKSGLGNGYSIIFAKENNFESLAASIRNNISVGCRQYKRHDGAIRYMAFGPTRLVRYAMFLMSEFYSVQDRLCFLEGELMNEVFSGKEWAKDMIEKIAEQIKYDKLLYFGRN